MSDQKEAGNVQIPTEQMEIYEFVVEGRELPFNQQARSAFYFRIFNDYRRGTSDLTYEDLPKLDIDWVEITSNTTQRGRLSNTRRSYMIQGRV